MAEESEFLLGQMGQWMDTLAHTERTEYLFELEMWLKSFERYFQVRNQPLSENAARTLALRSFYDEVALVSHAVHRVTQLCTLLASQDRVNQERFDKYVENFLSRDEVTDPYLARLLRQQSPEAGLTLLRESFEDLHLILSELTKLSRIPYTTFQSIGRLIYREVRRSDYLRLLMDQKFKPLYDRISSEPILEIIRHIEESGTRRLVAKSFLEFFRLLHYLDFIDPKKRKVDDLRSTLLIFSLITSETRGLLEYLESRSRRLPPGEGLQQVVDSFVYCIPLELRKVINTELSDLSSFKQADAVYMRIENSHGILRDCFQQSVVQLAQVFDSAVEGRRVFSNFAAKFEQSMVLREDLVSLIGSLRRFLEARDEASASAMKQQVSRFYDNSLKYLMYRDWSGFELFFIEILKCASLSGLVQIAHRFDTFLMTLLREVSKRSVLQGVVTPQERKAFS